MAYEFKKGDKGKTRNGRDYEVLADDLRGTYSVLAIVSDSDGKYSDTFTTKGLLYEGEVKYGDLLPPTQYAYINVYEREGFLSAGNTYATRARADSFRDGDERRVACFRIELERDRWDD